MPEQITLTPDQRDQIVRLLRDLRVMMSVHGYFGPQIDNAIKWLEGTDDGGD